MKSNSCIYIVGHENMIGKALIRNLKLKNYKNIVFNKYSSVKIDNFKKIKNFFKEKKPEYVFLVDGNSGGILANQKFPASLITSNLNSCLNIIPLAHKFGVKKLLYFASSCIYPKNAEQPLKPSQILSNYLEPTNRHYASAKILGMQLCEAYNIQYKTNFITVIPSNCFGPWDDFSQKNSHVISSLIIRMHKAKIMNKKSVKIWGSGKAVRDFIYIDDLALASIYLINNYKSKSPINVSNGKSYSIEQTANIIKKIIGFKGKLIYDRSKPDGMMFKSLDNSLITKLGWNNTITFNKALKKTYTWYKNNLL